MTPEQNATMITGLTSKKHIESVESVIERLKGTSQIFDDVYEYLSEAFSAFDGNSPSDPRLTLVHKVFGEETAIVDKARVRLRDSVLFGMHESVERYDHLQ